MSWHTPRSGYASQVSFSGLQGQTMHHSPFRNQVPSEAQQSVFGSDSHQGVRLLGQNRPSALFHEHNVCAVQPISKPRQQLVECSKQQKSVHHLMAGQQQIENSMQSTTEMLKPNTEPVQYYPSANSRDVEDQNDLILVEADEDIIFVGKEKPKTSLRLRGSMQGPPQIAKSGQLQTGLQHTLQSSGHLVPQPQTSVTLNENCASDSDEDCIIIDFSENCPPEISVSEHHAASTSSLKFATGTSPTVVEKRRRGYDTCSMTASDTCTSNNQLTGNKSSQPDSNILLLETVSLCEQTKHSTFQPSEAKSYRQLSAESYYRCGGLEGRCGFRTVVATQLELHMREAHPKDVAYPCVHCGSQQQSHDNLLHHLEEHLAMHTFFFNCMDIHCEFRSFCSDEVIYHMEQCHQVLDFHICWRCNSRFSNLQEFSIHIKQHLVIVFRCSLCSAKDVDRQSILTHMISSHPGDGGMLGIQKLLLCRERQKNQWDRHEKGVSDLLKVRDMAQSHPQLATPAEQITSAAENHDHLKDKQRTTLVSSMSVMDTRTTESCFHRVSDTVSNAESGDGHAKVTDSGRAVVVEQSGGAAAKQRSDKIKCLSIDMDQPDMYHPDTGHPVIEAESFHDDEHCVGTKLSNEETDKEIDDTERLTTVHDCNEIGAGEENDVDKIARGSVDYTVERDVDVTCRVASQAQEITMGDLNMANASDNCSAVETETSESHKKDSLPDGPKLADMLGSKQSAKEQSDLEKECNASIDSGSADKPDQWFHDTYKLQSDVCNSTVGLACQLCTIVSRSEDSHVKHIYAAHHQFFRGFACQQCAFISVEQAASSHHRCAGTHCLRSKTRAAFMNEKYLSFMGSIQSSVKTSVSSRKSTRKSPEIKKVKRKLPVSKKGQKGEIYCNLCGMRGSSHTFMQLHLYKEHSEVMKCPICGAGPDNDRLLYLHFYENHPDQLALYNTTKSQCHMSRNNLSVDSNITGVDEDMEPNVTGIDKGMDQTSLSSHQDDDDNADVLNNVVEENSTPSVVAPGNENTYTHSQTLRCKLCPFSDCQPEVLREHIFSKHTEVMKCPQCAMQPSSDIELYQHLSSDHADQCDRLYSLHRSLQWVKFPSEFEAGTVGNNLSANCNKGKEGETVNSDGHGIYQEEVQGEHIQEGNDKTRKNHRRQLYGCKLCNFTDSVLSQARAHIYEKHNGLIVCPRCFVKPDGDRQLYKHFASMHAEEKNALFAEHMSMRWIKGPFYDDFQISKEQTVPVKQAYSEPTSFTETDKDPAPEACIKKARLSHLVCQSPEEVALAGGSSGRSHWKKQLEHQVSNSHSTKENPKECSLTKRKTNFKYGLFQCKLCSYSIRSRATFYKHVFDQHPEVVQCSVCSARLQSAMQLRNHIMQKHPEKKGLYMQLTPSNWAVYCAESSSKQTRKTMQGTGIKLAICGLSSQKPSCRQISLVSTASSEAPSSYHSGDGDSTLLKSGCMEPESVGAVSACRGNGQAFCDSPIVEPIMLKANSEIPIYSDCSGDTGSVLCQAEGIESESVAAASSCSSNGQATSDSLSAEPIMIKANSETPTYTDCSGDDGSALCQAEGIEPESVAAASSCIRNGQDLSDSLTAESIMTKDGSDAPTYSACSGDDGSALCQAEGIDPESVAAVSTCSSNGQGISDSLSSEPIMTEVKSPCQSEIAAHAESISVCFGGAITAVNPSQAGEEKEYRCPHCTSDFSRRHKFYEHLCYHYHYRCFKCGHCPFLAFSGSAVFNHNKKTHCKEPVILHNLKKNYEDRIDRVMQNNHVSKAAPHTERRLLAYKRAQLKKMQKVPRKQNIKSCKTSKEKNVDSHHSLKVKIVRVQNKVKVVQNKLSIQAHKVLKQAKRRKVVVDCSASGEEKRMLQCPYCRAEKKPVERVECEVRFHIHYKPFCCPYCEMSSGSKDMIVKHIAGSHPQNLVTVEYRYIQAKEERFKRLMDRSMAMAGLTEIKNEKDV